MGYTKSAKAGALPEKWYVVDARDQVLGRLATDVALVLRGKHLTNFCSALGGCIVWHKNGKTCA